MVRKGLEGLIRACEVVMGHTKAQQRAGIAKNRSTVSAMEQLTKM